jgi:hypothetical protein
MAYGMIAPMGRAKNFVLGMTDDLEITAEEPHP